MRKVESVVKAPIRARWTAIVSFRAATAAGLENGAGEVMEGSWDKEWLRLVDVVVRESRVG